MSKKYEFTGETKNYKGRVLHRIRRISDGLVGGWIESERNLSHEGNCFVYDNGMVYDDGKVYGNGRVFDNGKVYNNAKICDNAIVYGNAEAYGNAKVRGYAEICDYTIICDNAEIFGDARMYDHAVVYSDAKVYNDATICGCAKVYGCHAEVFGNAEICDSARVCGDAKIYEGRIIGQISQSYKSVFQYQCKNRVLTAILTEEDEILYSIGCQDNITKETFLGRIYNEDGGLKENPHREEYLRLIPLIEQYFGKLIK